MENTQNTKLGRPSKFNEELVNKAHDYMLFDFANVDDAVPTVVGLAVYLGVTKSSVYEWASHDTELGRIFSDTLEAINNKQEKMLATNGLRGNYNSTITKLMMANHGYHERQEVTHIQETPKTLNDFYADNNKTEP